ncbi:catalytic activity protein [[Candida] boidinii]|nr:catalytic activity protein [[Candida] boidinii]OWB62201.1 catalytic activity protein [[Candida] boidinii]OWB72915.1 catalytic activity protein [[Candida] boidinii]OWB77951.1 catalytic activity protein [[Candida] boidinii]
MPAFVDNISDPEKFALWSDKIEAAKKRRDDSIISEYLLEKSELPAKDRLDVSKIPYETSKLTEADVAITEMPAPKIVGKIASGELTSTEVLTSFLKRATIAHQLLNCATEFLTDEALATAKELDEYYKETGKTKGPLHGLPVSIKEHVSIKGKVTHAGYVALLDNITPEDCVTVKVLRDLGAIPFVRTNEPQSLMHQDSTNYITGTTCNPFNTKLSSSGSSGGEGALIGFKGSVLGMGTDIGGSIRSPAAFNGCYGLRATSGRISLRNAVSAGAGQESVRSVIGPLAQHIEDIELFMESYIGSNPWKYDATLLHTPWKKVEKTKNFTVGVMRDDGIVQPHPPILRGIDTVVEKLKAAGIRVVEFQPHKCEEIWDVVSNMYFADGCKSQKGLLSKSGEPIHPLTAWAFQYGKGELTINENWALNAKRDQLRNEYQELMDERGVDFILTPAYLGVASELGTTTYWNYCAYWNLLDQPGLVFPTGLFQDPEIDTVPVRETYWSEKDEFESKKYHDANVFKGAPICLQLVGKRYEDEEVVAAGSIISQIINQK